MNNNSPTHKGEELDVLGSTGDLTCPSSPSVTSIVASIYNKFEEEAYVGGAIANHNSHRHEGFVSESTVDLIVSELSKLDWDISYTQGSSEGSSEGSHYVIFIGDKQV